MLSPPPPLADHPLSDPRPIWFAGLTGGFVALLSGAWLPTVAGLAAAWTGGAVLSHVHSTHRRAVRPWTLQEPWRAQVRRATAAWRQHAELAGSVDGPPADRLRQELAVTREVLENLWRIAQWGSGHADLARRTPSLIPEVRVALAEVIELADGLEAATASAIAVAAMVDRPAGAAESARHDLAELRETAVVYRSALGVASEAAR